MVPDAYYRAWLDPAVDEVEFVRFVGTKYSPFGFVFEAADGDLIIVSEIVAS